MAVSVEVLPDGRVELRIDRRLRHPRERVWQALTRSAELRAWFVDILDFDRSNLDFAPGAELTFVSEGTPAGRGRVTAFEPTEFLEYTWDAEILRWELTLDEAGCLLTFTNIVDSPETAAAVTDGWRTGLRRLAAYLDAERVNG